MILTLIPWIFDRFVLVDGFFLNQLPFLVFREILLNMTLEERIKLALTSKKMELTIRKARLKLKFYSIRLRDEESGIGFGRHDTFLQCGTRNSSQESLNGLRREELFPWLAEDDTNPIENSLKIFRKITDIFPIKKTCLSVNTDFMKMNSLAEILKLSNFIDFDDLKIFGTEIDARDLDIVMETMKENQDIYVGPTIPQDYYHENVFKFHMINYRNAQWIRLEHLLNLKNGSIIRLGFNSLTLSDFNRLIKKWVENEYEMWRWMAIYVKPHTFDIYEVLDGIVALKAFRFGIPFYLVSIKPSESRIRPILSINLKPTEIRLLSMKLITKTHSKTFRAREDPWIEEFKVLEILNEKKDLEKELLEGENDEISRKNINLKEKLDFLDVDYDSRIPTFRRQA